MGIACNGQMVFAQGVKAFGATVFNSSYNAVLHGNSAQTNRIRNLTAGEGITDDLVGLPSGYRHPGAWMMPQKAGAISARNTISGAGTFAATGQSGYNIDASISGSGDIPGCDLGLIVAIAAAISGSGGISSAQMEALASIAAALTGSGDITATAAGLADLVAAITGAGSVTAGNSALMDIAAEIVSYGSLTPEGIRDAVWQATATEFNDAGTMGEKLNSASSAGDPWGTTLPGAYGAGTAGNIVGNQLANILSGIGARMVESGMTQDEVTRILLAYVAGNVSGGPASPEFLSVDGLTVRIAGTADSSGNRTTTTLDGS